MNGRSKLFVLTILTFAGVCFALSAGASQIDATIDTYVVRPASVAAQAVAPAPATLLGTFAVGQRFCNALHCVVLTSTTDQRNSLEALEKQGLVSVEAVPDAHKLFFQKAHYDAAANAFEGDFPGRFDVSGGSEMAQFVLIFKSYPERGWLDQLEALGLVALEPVPVMGYTVYGPRKIIATLGKQFPFVYATLEVPSGLKRFNIDNPPEGDDLGPALTTVTMVTKTRNLITSLMSSASGTPVALVYRSGTSEAYAARLTLADSYGLSSLPEILSVYRETVKSGPSDERSNRLVAGDYQTPGTSWPSSLGANSLLPPYYQYYWNNFLSQLSNVGAGFDLSHQVIGFLDTGVDGGLQQAGQAYCPPHLRTPQYDPGNPTSADGCRLIFTTDVTTRFSQPDSRADDLFYHGTITTSIAAGFAGTYSSGRDAGGNYAFTQGVAQNAKLAMCQFFQLCGTSFRGIGEASPTFSNQNDDANQQLLRYALVELGSTSPLPDTAGGNGPGARIFNHSWNSCAFVYEPDTQLLDQTTRSLAMAYFNFSSDPNNPQLYTGPSVPALHIVSAGNFPGSCGGTDRQVTAPAIAKNVIAVGATETYNQETYTPLCAGNDTGDADNPHQIPDFSRFGYPNQRLRPDLVAPGTRAYGRRSVMLDTNCNSGNCDVVLDNNNPRQYTWNDGTSFSAPVVTGAAAIVREWLPTLGLTNPSPALVKATLINAARSLTNIQSCWTGCGTCCTTCGDMRPSPDQYQGWGGVSLDRLFRSSSNYFFYDQGTTLTASGQYYSHTVTIADASKDVNITLVWTDRASATLVDQRVNLVNDLDLYAVAFNGGQVYTWVGNDYYYSRDACTRDGYSLRNPSPVVYDRRNNVERINIRASDIPAGTTSITVQVVAYSLTGDGIDPTNNGNTFQQDFALAVENAR
jgi:hypothetical protein